ncbi:hypothetical protein AC578_10262 [Pseudocercospora eumusae]|uniref:Uncharacterized protein n=1 Tax=Pseudocercospora eumusae TaxID=321146 RepID=A0A139HZ35_9PEZI|nr:hypothetical protein AC578_10262 [Pseudocercospora eumusae]
MKPSTLLFCASTAQAAVLWWPQQHHAPGQPCGHHQQGQVSEHVTQTGPFSLRLPFIKHIRITWPFSNRPILPSPTEIANQVFDQHQDEATTPPETVQQEEDEKEVTILPYTGHLDDEDVAVKAEEEVKEGEDAQHEDLKRRKLSAINKQKAKRQFSGPAN